MSDSIPAAPLQFRLATTADVEAIVALVHSAYRGEVSRAGWTTEADLLDGGRTDAEEVTALIAAAESCVLVLEQDPHLIASAALARQGHTAYFGMFAVAPQLQSQGYGSHLLAEAERYARECWGCDAIEMAVITLRAELIAWYERRGYRRTGVFKPFPYGIERYGLPRRPDLRLELLRKPLC